MLKKLTFQPGVNKEGTDYSAEGGWYSSSLVRFRKGRPEKIGGWSKLSSSALIQGVCRKIHNWTSLDSSNYAGLGTSAKVYIEIGAQYFDVTPTFFTVTKRVSANISTGDSSITLASGGGDFTSGDLLKVDAEYMIVSSAPSATSIPVTRGEFLTVDSDHDESKKYGFPTVSGFPFITPASGEATSVGVIGIVNGSKDILIRFEDHPGAIGKFLTILKLGAAPSGGSGITAGDIVSPSGLKIRRILGLDNLEATTTGLAGVTANTTLTASGLDTGATVVVSSGGVFVENDFVKVGDEYIKLGPTSPPGVTFTSCSRGHFGSSVSAQSAGSPIAKVELIAPITGPKTYSIFDINSGSVQASLGQGWGMAAWGVGTWADTDITVPDFSTWAMDNWGQDLLASPSGGKIYYWDKGRSSDGSIPVKTGSDADDLTANGVTNAQMVPLSHLGKAEYVGHGYVPEEVNNFVTFPSAEMVLAFGCEGLYTPFDPMLTRWSDINHIGSWGPETTNAAGGNPIRTGSKIICGARVKSDVVIWTDEALYAMSITEAEGEVFAFREIADGISIIGSNAYAQAGNAVYWMDTNNFYKYDGNVSILPCTVLNYIFDDIDFSQKLKIFAARNAEFNEISFFYPRGPGTGWTGEPDRYASYNYAEGTWAVGDLPRTAWSDSGIRSNPIAAYIASPGDDTSGIYVHEDGWDADGSAMEPYIESGYFDIEDGEHLSFVSRIIPDVYFDSGDTLKIDVYKKDFPFDSAGAASSSTLKNGTGQVNLRIRGRQVAIRFKSDDLGVGWRLGDMRLDIRPDGRR